MASPDKSKGISFLARIGLVILFSRIFIATIIRAFTYPLVKAKGNGATTYFRDVMYAMIRKKLEIQWIWQYRLLDSPTPEVYKQWTKDNSLEELTEQLDSEGAQAHWIGKKNADRIIVYFHGGGYTQPIQPGYLHYLKDLKDVLSTSDLSVSVVMLSYSLSPELKFPKQLIQGLSLLDRLVHGEQRDPAAMILMGDSAGANLLLAIVSHILHPLKSIPSLTLPRPFRALVLMSPWVSFGTSSATYMTNANRDVLCASTLRRWSKMFRGVTVFKECYLEPLSADSGWWKNGHRVAERAAVWVGEHEVFLDDIVRFSSRLQTGWRQDDFELGIASKEVHCQPLVDVMMQMKAKADGALQLERSLRMIIQ